MPEQSPFSNYWTRLAMDDGFLEIGPLCFVLCDRHGLIICWKRLIIWELRP